MSAYSLVFWVVWTVGTLWWMLATGWPRTLAALVVAVVIAVTETIVDWVGRVRRRRLEDGPDD